VPPEVQWLRTEPEVVVVTLIRDVVATPVSPSAEGTLPDAPRGP